MTNLTSCSFGRGLRWWIPLGCLGFAAYNIVGVCPAAATPAAGLSGPVAGGAAHARAHVLVRPRASRPASWPAMPSGLPPADSAAAAGRTPAAATITTGRTTAVPAAPAGPHPTATRGAVSEDQVFPAPADGRYILDGHGFGTGIGLDQWGAEGGAISGMTYQQVLAHYYSGTKLVTVKTAPSVSVHLVEAGTGPVEVRAASGLTAVDGDAVWPLPATVGGSAAADWRVALAGGSEELEWSADGSTWTGWTPPGDSGPARTGTVGFTVSNATVRTVFPGGTTRDYFGVLNAVQNAGGLASVNVVSLRAYVDGVIPNESPASWGWAAIKAQAVAARSYALDVIAHTPAGAPWEICDTEACQVYGGADTEQVRTDEASAGTPRQVITYQGHLALTEYGASDGGWTAAGGLPYLAAAADSWDAVASPEHSWQRTVGTAAIQAAFPTVGTLRSLTVTSRDGNGQWGGRVLSITVTGSQRSVAVSGWAFSGALGLLANWFTVDPGSSSTSYSTSARRSGARVGAAATAQPAGGAR